MNLKINYNDKLFKPVQNSENGETTQETIFEYKQNANILTSKYEGGKIVKGHLIGLVDENLKTFPNFNRTNTTHGKV